MTYNDIVEYFKEIAIEINPIGTFIHGRRFDGSINYDEPLPQIHLYPWIGTPDIKNQSSILSMSIGFWAQDNQGNTLEQRQKVISDMDILCTAFLTRLETDAMGVVNSPRNEPQYLSLSGTLSGYILTFNFIVNLDC